MDKQFQEFFIRMKTFNVKNPIFKPFSYLTSKWKLLKYIRELREVVLSPHTENIYVHKVQPIC